MAPTGSFWVAFVGIFDKSVWWIPSIPPFFAKFVFDFQYKSLGCLQLGGNVETPVTSALPKCLLLAPGCTRLHSNCLSRTVSGTPLSDHRTPQRREKRFHTDVAAPSLQVDLTTRLVCV